MGIFGNKKPTSYYRPAARQEICRAILTGREAAAFEKFDVTPLDQLRFRECANEIIEAATWRRSPVRGYYAAPIGRPIWWVYALAGLTAVASLAFAAWLMTSVETTNRDTYPLAGAAAAFFAVFAASSGWGISSWISHRNSRVQHTINFVAGRFSHAIFNDNLTAFNSAFGDKPLTTALYSQYNRSDKPEDRAAAQAARYILNFFEFIAVGVLAGDLDARIVKKTLRGNIIAYFDQCLPFISDLRKGSPRGLEHLVKLRCHFEEA